MVLTHHQACTVVLHHHEFLGGDGAHIPPSMYCGSPSPQNPWWRWCSHTTKHVLWFSITTKSLVEMVLTYHQACTVVLHHHEFLGGDGAHIPPSMYCGSPSPQNPWWRWCSHTTKHVLWFSITMNFLVEMVLTYHQACTVVLHHHKILGGDGAHTPPSMYCGSPSPQNPWWRWCSHTTKHVLWFSITTKSLVEMVLTYHQACTVVLHHHK